MTLLGLILLLFSSIYANALELSAGEKYTLVISESLDASPIPIASISNNANEWTLVDLDTEKNIRGRYCISVVDSHSNWIAPCFNYKELTSPLQAKLLLETSSATSVDSISLISSQEAGISLSVKKTTFLKTPGLKTPEKTIVGLDGKPTTASEQEKSFIQKNWMYIVPPLLIVFFMSG